MKVIFVGMHNKPGMEPLDSKTKSGKLIDRVIEGLPDVECVKTNLYDSFHWPENFEDGDLMLWWIRVNADPKDIIVTLGESIHRRFKKLITIKLGHPSAIWSNDAKVEYVKRAIDKINLHVDLTRHHEIIDNGEIKTI